MAENKKSVLLYCDLIHVVDVLSDEEAGRLFKHYLRYINDLNPCAEDRLTSLLFEPIKQSLKRDLKKWEAKSLKNSENANKRWHKEDANASERMPTDANHADSVSVSVKDSVSDINKEIELQKQKASTIFKRLSESDTWLDTTCMGLRIPLPDKQKSNEYLKGKLHEFLLLQISSGGLDRTDKLITSHFVNWVRGEIAKDPDFIKKANVRK